MNCQRLPLLLLLLPLAACQENGYIRVTVEEADGGSGVAAVYQIRSLASDSDGGSPDVALGPAESAPIVFPKTFVVKVPPNVTSLLETVEGLDQTGATVVRGSDFAAFSAGSQATPMQVNLTQACGSSLDCDPTGFCQGEVFCTQQGACVASGSPTPPGFGIPCGSDGGRCTEELQCVSPFGFCGDGMVGADPAPDGGVYEEQCDWGNGDAGPCTGPDGGCNSLQPNHCRPDCVLPSCGDGVVDTGEKCDLGSRNGTEQGCNATCSLLGTATRIAGNGDVVNGVTCTSSCDADGAGAQAMFQEISGISVVGSTLYVADELDLDIRAVDLSSATFDVSTLAGNPNDASTQAGVGANAGFYLPFKPLSYQGSLLVGTGCAVQQVTLPGASVDSFAGPSTGNQEAENNASGVSLAQARFNKVTGLTFDPATGNVYTVDNGSGDVRQIIPDAGIVNDLAGGGMLAEFGSPTGAVVLAGSLYLTDTGNERIRAIGLGGLDGGIAVTDVAGSGSPGFADTIGTSPATFNGPAGLCTDGQSIYIVDQGNRAIRQFDPVTLRVTSVVGAPDAGPFDSPYDCAWDPVRGVLYVSDQSSPPATPDGKGDVIWMIQ